MLLYEEEILAPLPKRRKIRRKGNKFYVNKAIKKKAEIVGGGVVSKEAGFPEQTVKGWLAAQMAHGAAVL